MLLVTRSFERFSSFFFFTSVIAQERNLHIRGATTVVLGIQPIGTPDNVTQRRELSQHKRTLKLIVASQYRAQSEDF